MRRAFTLIELLVVIAIIAILAAILFPVFAQAKVAAKKTASVSNLKNITLASILYAGDYDDVLMQNEWWTPDYSKLYTWYGSHVDGTNVIDEKESFIWPYLKNRQIEMSPGAEGIPTDEYVGKTGYGYNWALAKDGWKTRTISATAIEKPSEIVMFGDVAVWDAWCCAVPTFHLSQYLMPHDFDGTARFHGRYGERGTLSWTDGHASSMKPVPVPDGMNPSGVPSKDYRAKNLGFLDKDGDLTTAELFYPLAK